MVDETKLEWPMPPMEKAYEEIRLRSLQTFLNLCSNLLATERRVGRALLSRMCADVIYIYSGVMLVI